MIPLHQGGGGPPLNSKLPFQKPASLFAALIAILLLGPSARADALRGTLVHEETLHVAPSADAAKLSQVDRGHELIIIETSRDWAHVQAIMMEPRRERDEDEEAEAKTVSGWLPAKAVVLSTNPIGDKIVFGEAADSEDQASRRRGRREAAKEAMRLYYRVYDLFPNSPLAAEGLYRAADIRWQIEKSERHDASVGPRKRSLHARTD